MNRRTTIGEVIYPVDHSRRREILRSLRAIVRGILGLAIAVAIVTGILWVVILFSAVAIAGFIHLVLELGGWGR